MSFWKRSQLSVARRLLRGDPRELCRKLHLDGWHLIADGLETSQELRIHVPREDAWPVAVAALAYYVESPAVTLVIRGDEVFKNDWQSLVDRWRGSDTSPEKTSKKLSVLIGDASSCPTSYDLRATARVDSQVTVFIQLGAP